MLEPIRRAANRRFCLGCSGGHVAFAGCAALGRHGRTFQWHPRKHVATQGAVLKRPVQCTLTQKKVFKPILCPLLKRSEAVWGGDLQTLFTPIFSARQVFCCTRVDSIEQPLTSIATKGKVTAHGEPTCITKRASLSKTQASRSKSCFSSSPVSMSSDNSGSLESGRWRRCRDPLSRCDGWIVASPVLVMGPRGVIEMSDIDLFSAMRSFSSFHRQAHQQL